MQSGWFIAPCHSTLAGGKGLGLTRALAYDIYTNSSWAVGMKSGIQYQSFTDYEVAPGDIHTRLADGDHEEISLSYLNFDPYIRYTFSISSIFLQPGFSYHSCR